MLPSMFSPGGHSHHHCHISSQSNIHLDPDRISSWTSACQWVISGCSFFRGWRLSFIWFVGVQFAVIEVSPVVYTGARSWAVHMDVETTKRRQVASARLAARGAQHNTVWKLNPRNGCWGYLLRMSASPRVGWQWVVLGDWLFYV